MHLQFPTLGVGLKFMNVSPSIVKQTIKLTPSQQAKVSKLGFPFALRAKQKRAMSYVWVGITFSPDYTTAVVTPANETLQGDVHGFSLKQILNWVKYERVRLGGRFNMFDPRAREMTNLTRDEWCFCIDKFNELKKDAIATGRWNEADSE